MSSGIEFPDGPSKPVRVARECQGPVGGECDRRIVAHVPSFDNADEKQGVECDGCGRVNHVDWHDVLGGGDDA